MVTKRFLFTTLLMAFLLGFIAASLSILTFGRDTYRLARRTIFPPPATLTPLPNPSLDELSSYTPQIPMSGMSEIDAKRTDVINYVFGGELPGQQPAVNDTIFQVQLPNELTSTAHLKTPDELCFADTLVIYHAGHNTSQSDQNTRAVGRLLAAGHTVIVMDMPLVGQNQQIVMFDLPNVGTVPIREVANLHNMMIFIDGNAGVSVLRYFVEPVVSMVNWATAEGYEHIYLMGLSGGGWTTSLTAAVDERIDASYAVAGSIPLGMRFDRTRDLGDYEQQIPDFYMRVATYEDLYILSAAGRRALHVLNEFDSCCFSETRYELYEEPIQTFLGDAGTFDVFWDEGNRGHTISDEAMALMLADMTDGIPSDARLCAP